VALQMLRWLPMKSRIITQRELRNQSGAVLREVEAGRTIVVTRNGTPVGELRPIGRHRFVRRATIVDAAGGAPRIDADPFRADLLIASTAAANGLPLYTRNASDFDALKRIIKVIGI